MINLLTIIHIILFIVRNLSSFYSFYFDSKSIILTGAASHSTTLTGARDDVKDANSSEGAELPKAVYDNHINFLLLDLKLSWTGLQIQSQLAMGQTGVKQQVELSNTYRAC